MHRRKYLVLLAFILLVTLPGLSAGTNLVTNPGFETGNFSGWTTVAASSGSDFRVDGHPSSGSYAAWFGATEHLYDVIFQYFSDTPGQTYQFSFVLANSNADSTPDNSFRAYDSYNYSITIAPDLKLLNASDQPYILYSFIMIGSGTDWVEFDGYNRPSFYYLDDVSVTAVPEPTSLLLLGSGLIGLAGYGRKKFFKK